MSTHTENCECGKPFTYEVDETIREFDRPQPPWQCPECEHARKEAFRQQAVEEHTKEARAFLHGFLPPRMAQTDRQDPRFNGKLWEKVSAWMPTDEKPWLGLIGPTGKGKTRCAYERLVDGILAYDQPKGFVIHAHAAKHYDERHWHVMDLPAVDFARAVRSQYSQDKAEEKFCKKLLSRAHDVRWLLIDDLGKCTHTPAVAAELFSLIDHRHNLNLPTIWTANSRPEQFFASMPSDVGDPLRGRLIECSTIFELK